MARIGYPILMTRTTLARRTEVTPSMLRLTLAGPELAGFHTYQADDHVRLVLALPDGTRNDPVPNDRAEAGLDAPAPAVAQYTVRRFDAEACELTSTSWSTPAGSPRSGPSAPGSGEEVVVAGPPGAKAFPHTQPTTTCSPWTRPACRRLARWLEESPADVVADVLVDHDHSARAGLPARGASRRHGAVAGARRRITARRRGRLGAAADGAQLPARPRARPPTPGRCAAGHGHRGRRAGDRLLEARGRGPG